MRYELYSPSPSAEASGDTISANTSYYGTPFLRSQPFYFVDYAFGKTRLFFDYLGTEW
jgi:hypothetical protein